MQIQTKPSNKKLTYAAILVVVILVAGVVYFLFLNKPKSATTTPATSDSSPTTSRDKTAQTQSVGLPADSAATTTDKIPTSDTLSVSVSSFAQSNGTVDATAKTSADGTCVFTYVPADGGKPVTRQVATSSSTCTASIPTNEFTYLGKWSLTVTLYSNSQKAEVQRDVAIS